MAKDYNSYGTKNKMIFSMFREFFELILIFPCLILECIIVEWSIYYRYRLDFMSVAYDINQSNILIS